MVEDQKLKTLVVTGVAVLAGLAALAFLFKKTASKSAKLVLYIYEHCPYCTKAQMIFGYKKVAVDVQVFLNDDEKTPVSYVGNKQVPILKKADGTYMPESMDIVHYINNHVGGAPVLSTAATPAELDAWLKSTEDLNRKLTYPRYVNPAVGFKEFATQAATDYFVNKKEKQFGGKFADWLADSDIYKAELEEKLQELEKLLPVQKGFVLTPNALSEADIHLFARLRGFTVIKGFKWTPRARKYIDFVSRQTGVALWESKSV